VPPQNIRAQKTFDHALDETGDGRRDGPLLSSTHQCMSDIAFVLDETEVAEVAATHDIAATFH